MAPDADLHIPGLPSAMLQVDVVLPAQYFGAANRLAPERRLMIAVLHDALLCLEKHRVATSRRGRRLFHETMQWLLAEDPNWPYSFASICGVLDLDADAVRRELLVVRACPSVPGESAT